MVLTPELICFESLLVSFFILVQPLPLTLSFASLLLLFGYLYKEIDISMQSVHLLNEAKLATLVAKRKAAINKYASTSHWSVSNFFLFSFLYL